MSLKLKDHLTNTFRDNIINVNNVEYVNLDIFLQAVSELAALDSMLGALALKTEDGLMIPEDEVIDYMVNNSDKIVHGFENGFYVIKKIN